MTEQIRWRKSTRSGASNNGCVELAHTMNLIRDSKNPTGPTLTANASTLLATVKEGHLPR